MPLPAPSTRRFCCGRFLGRRRCCELLFRRPPSLTRSRFVVCTMAPMAAIQSEMDGERTPSSGPDEEEPVDGADEGMLSDDFADAESSEESEGGDSDPSLLDPDDLLSSTRYSQTEGRASRRQRRTPRGGEVGLGVRPFAAGPGAVVRSWFRGTRALPAGDVSGGGACAPPLVGALREDRAVPTAPPRPPGCLYAEDPRPFCPQPSTTSMWSPDAPLASLRARFGADGPSPPTWSAIRGMYPPELRDWIGRPAIVERTPSGRVAQVHLQSPSPYLTADPRCLACGRMATANALRGRLEWPPSPEVLCPICFPPRGR